MDWNDIEFSVSGNLKSKNNTRIYLKQSWKVSDIRLDFDFKHEKWFPWNAEYVYSAVNYTVEDKTELSIEYDKSSFLKINKEPKNQILATSLEKSQFQVDGDSVIPICSFEIVPGMTCVCLDIKVHIKATGSLEVVCTTRNYKGIEYRKGNGIRYIKEESKDTDINFNVNIEATLYVGCSLVVLKYFNIAGVGIEGGIGVEAKGILHYKDSANHLLNEVSFNCGDVNPQMLEDYLEPLATITLHHEVLGDVVPEKEICYEITTYGILRFTIDPQSFLSKITGDVEIEIFGKEHGNSKIEDLCRHIEDGQKVPKCTRKYRTIPKNAKTTTSSDSTNSTTSTTSSTSPTTKPPIINDNTYRDIVLVLDTSASMQGTPFSKTVDSAKTFVSQVAGGNTRVGVVSYDTSTRVISQPSNSVKQLTEDIDELRLGNRTNMYAGLSEADAILKQSSAEKKIIVLMSDGLPNESPNISGYSYEPYGDEVVAYADQLKTKGYFIYTLGFFQELHGSDLVFAQDLMARIAGEGYYYDINEADSINFFFNDVANDIAGQHTILIKIACPVDVYITHNGETLTSDQNAPNNRTSFGSITYTGENDEVKNVRLLEDADYDVVIQGTGNGVMNYIISYPDENGAYTDVRTFEALPVTEKTVVKTNTKHKRRTVLKLDSDGDGHTDVRYRAGKGETGEVTPDYSNVMMIFVVLLALGVAVKWIGLERLKALVAVNRPVVSPVGGNGTSAGVVYCENCGGVLNQDGPFCPHCGFDNTRAMQKRTAVAAPSPCFCGKCGNLLKPHTAFCGKCGNKITIR